MRSPYFSIVTVLGLAIVAGGSGQSTVGAASDQVIQYHVPPVFEPVGEYQGFTYVARRMARDQSADVARRSSFVVTYTGFSPEAQAAFQYAVDIWSGIVQSSVPIRINARLRTDYPPYVLGAAGTTTILANFPNARRANTYYPGALANALAGTDLVTGDEISADFNANFSWDYGTDGNARDRFDFVTVVLHEIGHGLGFFGTLRVQDNLGLWGMGPQPAIYDWFVTNGAGQFLMDTKVFPNNSTVLANSLQNDDVHYAGAVTRSVDPNGANLFAPSPWLPGSSLVHLSDALYPNGDVNSLMTPALAPGEVIHDPGPLATAMLADMGWTIASAAPPAAPNVVGGLRLSHR